MTATHPENEARRVNLEVLVKKQADQLGAQMTDILLHQTVLEDTEARLRSVLQENEYLKRQIAQLTNKSGANGDNHDQAGAAEARGV